MIVFEVLFEGLLTAGEFFWVAMWALLLGFMLSGAIQAFVSKEGMVGYMGDSGPKSIFWATAFGVASTSCSFGDIAATKSLFKKGAHLIPSLAFMVASTNFVIGLSFVIWALLGWEFAVAQAVGAPILILLVLMLTHFFVSYDEAEEVRQRLIEMEQPVVTDPVCKMRINRENAIIDEYKKEQVHFCSKDCKRLFHQNPNDFTTSWKEKITSWNGWVDAANQTVKDLKMLWKELVFGFLLAGLIAAIVPDQAWTVLFEVDMNQFLEVVYFSFLGVIICMLTFVGSMGNVPLAAVLRTSGFGFAGVISFIYADLVVPQLIKIYRKIFGKKIGNQLTVILMVSMAATGVIIFYLFDWLDLIPPFEEIADRDIATYYGFTVMEWMNFLFIGIAMIYAFLLIRGKQDDPSEQEVNDPVTGREFTVKDADWCAEWDGRIYYFESEESRQKFRDDPEKFLKK